MRTGISVLKSLIFLFVMCGAYRYFGVHYERVKLQGGWLSPPELIEVGYFQVFLCVFFSKLAVNLVLYGVE